MKKALLVVALALSFAALADKTVVYLTAGSVVDRMTFITSPSGVVVATVCGHTTVGAGGVSAPTCYDVTLPSIDSVAVAVNALASGSALVFWKTKEGL